MNLQTDLKQGVAICLLAGALAACASTPETAGRWTASASVDPITGVERCVVTVPDRSFGSAFSRTGSLYPFVEQNSELGLMVGVSSGGRYRLPTGDIDWRVDDNPHHTLKAADTPSTGGTVASVSTEDMSDAQARAYEQSMEDIEGMVFSIQNGVTAAGGEKAEALLAELRAGSELRFRSKGAAPSAGLVSSSTYLTGRFENGQLVPIILDESFEVALRQCGL